MKINLELTNITDLIYQDNYLETLNNIFEIATSFLILLIALSWLKENEKNHNK